jgi:hypothetical protein
MSDELNTIEKVIEEVLIDLMAEKVMSVGAQASSTRGVQASPSTAQDPDHPDLQQRKEPSIEMTWKMRS